MKYYKLINDSEWKGIFKKNKIYRSDFIEDLKFPKITIQSYVNDWSDDWEEVSKYEYLIQEFHENYKIGDIIKSYYGSIKKLEKSDFDNPIYTNNGLFTSDHLVAIYLNRIDSWSKIIDDKKMELKITKEKVLEAANKCSTAKETLKTLFPEVFKEEVFYKTGDRFLYKDNYRDIEYILAQTGYKIVALINLENGNREIDAVCINNSMKITQDEFIKIAGSYYENFKKIN